MRIAVLALAAALPLVASALPPPPPPEARTEGDLLRELDGMGDLAGQDKPFEISVSLGKLYYANGRFKDAAAHMEQAAQKGEPLRKLWLEQSKRALARGPKLPDPEEAWCGRASGTLEERTAAAGLLAGSGKAAQAASCAKDALGPLLEARNILTGALFHSGKAARAIEVAELTLQAAPEDAEAVYLHASLLFDTRGDDLASLRKAKEGFERYARLRPMTQRSQQMQRLAERAQQAIAAGGLSKLSPPPSPAAAAPTPPPGSTGLAPLSADTQEAFGKVERTPELLARLARTVEEAELQLAKGRFADALEGYKQVMPLQPENDRMRAGMAWTLLRLDRQPMGDTVWGMAVKQSPESVDTLGKRLQALGDADGAKALWHKLAQSDPAYAKKVDLASRTRR